MWTVRSILFSLLFFVIISSCKKSDSDSNTSPPIPPAPKDTLAPGWAKIIVSDTPLLFDIFFINNTGFAISESGVYKSVDGGSTWKNVLSNGHGISNEGMGSETNAAFAISPQRLVATQDGGISFDTVTVSDASISDVFFVTPSIAYAVGNSFWKTIDAGLHWSKLHDFPNHGTGNYQTLYFLDEQTGWAIRYDSLYKTTDGGLSWQAQNVRIPGVTTQANVVFFTNTNHGFISDWNAVAATADGGSTWSKVFSASSNNYHDLHFLNDNVGYTSDGQYIFKTIDGGATWTKEASVPGVTFYELHFTDANHGWACGSGGVILKFKN